MTTTDELLRQGTQNLLEAFNGSPAFSSQSLTYNPATLKMNSKQLNASNSFKGYSSEKLANKLAEYASKHKDDGGLAALWQNQQQGTGATKASSLLATSKAGAVTGAGTLLAASAAQDPAFSYSALLSTQYGFRVVYCIVWITLGLFLLFFGLPSFYWVTTSRFTPKAGKTSRRIIGGGIGGLVVGFLSGSFLSGIITNAVTTRHQSTLSAAGMFAIWLTPGLLLCALSAHLLILSRLFLGLLAGVCLTLILTATFGIHTILVRSILLAIFCVALPLPLVIPPKTRYRRTKRFLLNLNTSLIGAVTFLDGVALFAPPLESSRAWIDLWTLLFAPDDSPSQHLTIQYWGSSAFKGYISGAVLAVAVSVAFEAWFHRNAGESVEDEWNEYLGVYTGRMEKGGGAINDDTLSTLPSANTTDRAGMFEEAKPLWRRILDRLDDSASASASRPAQYGNIAGGNSAPAPGGFSFTTRKPSNRQRASRHSSRSSATPARFQAVGKKGNNGKLDDLAERGEFPDSEDEFDAQSDSDATDVEDSTDKPSAKRKNHFSASAEALDTVAALPKLVNYGGYALPAATSPTPSSRPPSFRTDSGSSNGGTGSQLSGSTAVTNGSLSASSDAEKPFTSYRDSSSSARSFSTTLAPGGARAAPRLSAPPSFGQGGAANLTTPATPSLINAIERIQRAQEQAKQWAAQGTAGSGNTAPNAEPYGPQNTTDDLDDVKKS